MILLTAKQNRTIVARFFCYAIFSQIVP